MEDLAVLNKDLPQFARHAEDRKDKWDTADNWSEGYASHDLQLGAGAVPMQNQNAVLIGGEFDFVTGDFGYKGAGQRFLMENAKSLSWSDKDYSGIDGRRPPVRSVCRLFLARPLVCYLAAAARGAARAQAALAGRGQDNRPQPAADRAPDRA